MSIFHVENRVFLPAKGTGGLQQHHKFFIPTPKEMENSILKISGSVDVKITPDLVLFLS